MSPSPSKYPIYRNEKVLGVIYGSRGGTLTMDNTVSQIKFDRRCLGELIRNGDLRVPANQRDFAWERGHVDDFCNDLTNAIREGQKEYFLGTLVVIPEHEHLMVVDGQQRLATSMIVLAAIRDYYMATKDKNGADLFAAKWLYETHPLTKERDEHLVLNETDSSYFFERVLLPPDDENRIKRQSEEPTKPSHKLIDKASKRVATLLKEFISSVAKDSRLKHLDQLVEFLAKGAAIIFVTVPTEASAYMIFETMNDRGLELSAVDLIKNYMFGRAKDGNNFEAVKANWKLMIGNLESMGEEERVRNCIRHYWISKKGVVRTQDLFKSLKNDHHSATQVKELSDNLQRISTTYAALVSPSSPVWNQYPASARESLEALKTLGISQTRPLLLAAVENFSIPECGKLLISLEGWAVRLIAAGSLGTGSLEQVFGRIAKEISDRRLKSAKDIEMKIKGDIPEDKQFAADFAAMTVGNHQIAKYFLRSLELEAKPYLVPSKTEQITLEHVMPENRSDDWKHISEDTHTAYVHRLGNLALLLNVDNSTFKDKGFSVKKPIFAGVKLIELTNMIGNCEDWNVEEITKRQEFMAERAVRAWPRESVK